jgi:hypothetical protein
MDTNTALLGTGTGGTILTILYFVYKTFNHKRCRSNCCGRAMDLSLDIENTTPPPDRFEVRNPARNHLPIDVVVP